MDFIRLSRNKLVVRTDIDFASLLQINQFTQTPLLTKTLLSLLTVGRMLDMSDTLAAGVTPSSLLMKYIPQTDPSSLTVSKEAR